MRGGGDEHSMDDLGSACTAQSRRDAIPGLAKLGWNGTRLLRRENMIVERSRKKSAHKSRFRWGDTLRERQQLQSSRVEVELWL